MHSKKGVNDFLKSIVAGICVSIGCICYLSIDNKIIGSLLFSFGLLSIITYKLNLYTGKIGIIKTPKDILDCIIYLIGNVIGCAIIHSLIKQTYVYNNIYNKLQTVMIHKTSLPVIELFILGIICGILILLASKNSSNIVLTVLCISVFIIIGAEHSIANSFYLLECDSVFTYIKNVMIVAVGNAIGSIIINKFI